MTTLTLTLTLTLTRRPVRNVVLILAALGICLVATACPAPNNIVHISMGSSR